MFDRAPVSSCFSKSWDFNSRSSRLSLAMKPKSTFACYEIKVDSRLLWTTTATTLYSLLYKLNVDSRLLWSQSRPSLAMKPKSTLACYEAKVDSHLLWSQSRLSLAINRRCLIQFMHHQWFYSLTKHVPFCGVFYAHWKPKVKNLFEIRGRTWNVHQSCETSKISNGDDGFLHASLATCTEWDANPSQSYIVSLPFDQDTLLVQYWKAFTILGGGSGRV